MPHTSYVHFWRLEWGSKQFVYLYRKEEIVTIVLYPNDQTIRTIIDIVQSGRSSISWVFNNEPSLLYDPTIIGPAKVFSNRQAGDYVVMNGNSGLAAAVSGSYGFTWNYELGHAQDDAAQIAIACNSPFANLDV